MAGKKMKWFKILVKLTLVWLAVCLVAILTSPLWLGPVARVVATAVAPKLTGTELTIEKLAINPFTGTAFIENCHLRNPEGYSIDDAFSVQTVKVDIAVCKLSPTYLEVESLEVRGLRGSYISNGSLLKKGENNFDVILANVNSNFVSAEDDGAEASDAQETAGEPAPEMKIVLDKFELSDTVFYTGMGGINIPIPVPPISLGGITSTGWSDFWNELSSGVMKPVKATGDGLKDGVGATGDAMKAVGDSVMDATRAANEKMREAADMFKSLFKK